MRAVLLALLLLICSAADEQCGWTYGARRHRPDAVEVFWINMDKSAHRRISMENHLNQLGILHRRVRGLSVDEIYFPPDILSTWNQYEAQIQTKESIPATFTNTVGKVVNYTHFMNGLVGRTKANRLKEVGCTASHLEAMRLAIFANRTASKYALITEDDIHIPFNIDFDALVASAPNDFGILQLFNSNEESMKSTFERYIRSGQKPGNHVMWTEVRRKQAAAFWSTCAYLINRDVMRSVIAKVAHPIRLSHEEKIALTIVAGIEKPCRPKLTACCQNIPGTDSYAFQLASPCFIAPKGFQADSFLYAMTKTYVISVPMITNGQGGNESTFHQDHVEGIHAAAFLRQRTYINSMISGAVPLPVFLSKACQQPLQLAMQLTRRPSCEMVPYFSMPLPWSLPVHSVHTLWRNREIPYKNISATLPLSVVPWARREEMFLPSDILSTWETKQCLLASAEMPALDVAQVISLWSEGFRYSVSGLCGRRKANSLEDLSRSLSHLRALYDASHPSSRASVVGTPRYALITEGIDLLSPFQVNFTALIASAPDDFAVLRLFQSDVGAIDKYWNSYLHNNSILWPRNADRNYDEMGPKLYIVDTVKIANRINAMVHRMAFNKTASLYDFKVIGGIKSPCLPQGCCTNGSFVSAGACIVGNAGYQAERLLWRLGPTYTLTVPLFTAQMNDNHLKSPQMVKLFGNHRKIMNLMINGRAPMPAFVQSLCKDPVADIE